MQPVAHGCTLLQLPLHAAKPLLSVRNWRADTVPAHSTAVTIAVMNVDLSIFLPMIAPSSNGDTEQCPRGVHSIGFFGGFTGPGSLTHAPDVPLKIWQMQAPLQGFVALQVPVQVGSRLDFFCNWRAETVPAQRTAVTMAIKNVFLIVFLIINRLPFLASKMTRARWMLRPFCCRPYAASGRQRQSQSLHLSRPSPLFPQDQEGWSAA